MKKLLLIIVSLVLAGVANASVWNPAGNGIVPPDVGLWSDGGNWTPNGVPTSADTVVFNLADPAECQVTGAQQCGTFVMGDHGAASPQNAVLCIMPGASLTMGWTNGWCAIGHSRDAGSVIVERGALLDIDAHLYIGMNDGGSGRLIINGGTVLVADTFRYGREAGAEGYVDLNAGLFQARYLNSTGPYGGLFDIAFGKYRLTGGENSDRDRLQRDIDNVYITCFGGAGTPIVTQEANGDWCVICNPDDDPLARTPTYDAIVAWTTWDRTLSWINLPANSGSDVWVDVRFGTDPSQNPNGVYADFPLLVDAGLNTTSLGVTPPASGEYFWQVVTYQHGHPAKGQYNYGDDPNIASHPVVEGMLMAFQAIDIPPEVVIDTPPTVTWPNEPVQLDATVFDDGQSPVTYAWTSDEPNAVFTPSDIVEDPTVTVNYPAGTFHVTITVTDSSPVPGDSNTDTLELYCADNPCQAAIAVMPPFVPPDYPADVNGDCEHDLADFAVIAGDWLTDYTLTEPTVMP